MNIIESKDGVVSEFKQCVKVLRMDLEKLKFDLQNLSILLDSCYYYINK